MGFLPNNQKPAVPAAGGGLACIGNASISDDPLSCFRGCLKERKQARGEMRSLTGFSGYSMGLRIRVPPSGRHEAHPALPPAWQPTALLPA